MLDYASFPEQRQALIRARLDLDGRVQCVELALQLQVSEHTIRRDLQDLAAAGICKRVYGGAITVAPSAGDFAVRADHAQDSKVRLGQAAAALVRANLCIFIDAGTTNLAVAHALPADVPMTVVTNAPAIALAAMARGPKCEVIMLGGRLQPRTGAALGGAPHEQIMGMHFDQCFLGVCGVDPQAGLTAFDFDDASFKKAAVRQSDQIIVALTADKIPSIARYQIAPCTAASVLVVERSVPAGKLAAYTDLGLHIEYA